MTNVNQAALASPIYNPEVSDLDMQLQALMEPPPQEIIDQYRDIILNMPTQSPFSGLLVNPRGCDISQAFTDVSEAKAHLNDLTAFMQGQGGLAQGSNLVGGTIFADSGHVMVTPQEREDWQTLAPELMSDMETADSGLVEFQDHTNRMIANFASMVGMAQAAMGAAGALGSLDPCGLVGDFMGSLMDKGQAMMAGMLGKINAFKDRVRAAIQDIKSKVMGTLQSQFASVRDVIDKLKGHMAEVMETVNNIKAMVRDELDKFVNSMIAGMRSGLAGLLSSLPNDACLGGLVDQVASGPAKNILNKAKSFANG